MEYEASEDSAVLSFSAKFPSCPMAVNALEIRYRCVEDCEGDTEERVVMTKCTSLSAWLESAQLEVRQCMRLIAEFSELQPFSASRVFRPRERRCGTSTCRRCKWTRAWWCTRST